ncbi:MAG: MFS transporter, partial [Planctomycetia bacterium]|nr:MFS transporter [Planctomycetia bacterium]
MNQTRLLRLWVMAFLQYFVFGAWYVTMGTYLTETLGCSGGQVGLAYGTPALGAMIAPFFVGMVADRFFATETIMAALHLLGAVLLYAVSQLTTFTTIYPALIVYASAYMATLALTNSLTLHQLDEPDRQFPLVMSMGSVGWIVAGLVIGQLGVEKSAAQFRIAALASAVMGVYSLTLSHTPPSQGGAPVSVGGVLGLDALRLLKVRSFAVFVLGSFLICVPLSFYFAWTNVFLNEIGVDRPATNMTLGQVSDVTFLLLMPFLVGRLGVKAMLLIGMSAWSLRFVLFAAYAGGASAPPFLYVGILL